MLQKEVYHKDINSDVLKKFLKKNVSNEMINFLVEKTNNIIKIKRTPDTKIIELKNFIKILVISSNVQTPTLMSTAVFLDKLRAIIPSNVRGIESTRHRMFLGCLILSAKSLNDSSPLNKHWAAYSRGLLTLKEINTIERELLSYFKWNIRISSSEIIDSIRPLLIPIRDEMEIQTKSTTEYLLPTPLASPKHHTIHTDGYSTPPQYYAEIPTTPLSMTSPSSVASTYCESASPLSHRSSKSDHPYITDNSSTPNLPEPSGKQIRTEKNVYPYYDSSSYNDNVSNSLIDLININDALEKMAYKTTEVKPKKSRWSLIF